MSLALVLSVGSDPLLLESRNLLLQFAGYTAVAAFSAAAAIRQFREGDFDLVLLDHSLSIRDREDLTRSVRTFGSRIPILSICPGFDEEPSAENCRVMNDPRSLLTGVRKALSDSSKTGPSALLFASGWRIKDAIQPRVAITGASAGYTGANRALSC